MIDKYYIFADYWHFLFSFRVLVISGVIAALSKLILVIWRVLKEKQAINHTQKDDSIKELSIDKKGTILIKRRKDKGTDIRSSANKSN